MAHDPVEQGQDKYNSFLSSMFILITGVSGREMLILLLYFLLYGELLKQKLQTKKLSNH